MALCICCPLHADGTGRGFPLTSRRHQSNSAIDSCLIELPWPPLGRATNNGLIRLPRRNGRAGQIVDGGGPLNVISSMRAVNRWLTAVRSRFHGQARCAPADAFLAADLEQPYRSSWKDWKSTPLKPRKCSSRPRWCAGSSGYPDSRIFAGFWAQQYAVNATLAIRGALQDYWRHRWYGQ